MKEALAEHAEYLTRYLGDTHINHAMMHMQGLFMIATFCPKHERAPYWRQLAVERLELCLVHQIGPEGIQSELTTHYHDASIEMFGTPYLLGRLSGHPFPASYGEQLARMAAFTEAMIRPDGRSHSAWRLQSDQPRTEQSGAARGHSEAGRSYQPRQRKPRAALDVRHGAV